MAKILIIDDDAAVAGVMAAILEEAGHQAVTATTEAAREQALRAPEPFDGAIVDVWLGNEDGLRVAGSLRQLSPPLPFVIVSGGGPGRSLETVTARADALGARTMLYKPFDNDELLAAVEEMLAPEENRR